MDSPTGVMFWINPCEFINSDHLWTLGWDSKVDQWIVSEDYFFNTTLESINGEHITFNNLVFQLVNPSGRFFFFFFLNDDVGPNFSLVSYTF